MVVGPDHKMTSMVFEVIRSKVKIKVTVTLVGKIVFYKQLLNSLAFKLAVMDCCDYMITRIVLEITRSKFKGGWGYIYFTNIFDPVFIHEYEGY